ncbi:VCBS repeat-containing protein [Micromonospora sp. DR5-3]|uniref:FG-GAP repeat domain-containing protein n=1 Tax=unclassified Micromonospora TaxID=2617518 RepID=UPI0011D7460D|nr:MULTISPECIES: VCBS repeat-containing protein [unclassified Micromonospora]MCW3816456.1 VCBS repeat-containing protein [Micromonospora sp. DR5-3]TYC21252.1 VCBS repeat-containing protein [Micromonospora sp. MP36]
MGRTLTAGALASTTTLALSLLVAPGTPAVAEPSAAPREVAVIPQNEPTVLPREKLLFAGKTGFLHQHNASTAYLWTRYDTGETVEVKDLAGVRSSGLRPAGGDTVSIWESVPAHPTNGTVNVLDLGDLSWEQWKRPTDAGLYGIYGRDMLVRQGAKLELRTVGPDGTVTASRPVTGFPAGIDLGSQPLAGDGASVVIEAATADEYWWALLDLATARVVEIPDVDVQTLADFRLTGDTVAWLGNDATVHAYSRTGLLDGTDTTARTVTAGNQWFRLAMLGDQVLTVIDKRNGKDQGPAVTVPLGGGEQHSMLPLGALDSTALLQGPDDTALLVGGTDSGDWAVHRFTATDSQPTHVPVLPVRDPVGNAALSYRHGIVGHLQTQVSPSTSAIQYALFNRALADDDGSGNGRQLFPTAGTLLADAAPCAPQVSCVRMLDGADTGMAYLTYGPNGETAVARHTIASTKVSLPTANGRLVDADDRYAVVNGGSPAVQYVVDMNRRTVERSGPVTGAGLWYDTLWTATTTPGQLQQIGLGGNGAQRTIATGVACVPTEVQVSTRWLYWACGAGQAGAYDLTANRNVALPGGPALLGDGFLVRHDAGTASLLMTDFHDGTVRAAVKLADLPVGTPADDRGITWTVDRAGAGVAYVDGANAVHVLDSGVPATAPALGKVWTQGEASAYNERAWSGSFRFTRPVSSWQVTVTHKATGQTYEVRSGGAAREGASAGWDGRLPDGTMAVNGGYRWTVYGTVDGTRTSMGSGTLLAACGTFRYRTWDCYGGQALLGVKSNGEGHWYGEAPGSEPLGRLNDLGATDNWCLSCTGSAGTTALVPFGDFTGDHRPDLLVRDAAGYLRVYYGTGRNAFPKSGTMSHVIGKGWETYRLLLAPGDLNRDGHDDLVGVDTTGKLWLYTSTGTGYFTARVQIGSGWGIYPKVLGMGDLNGDGNGDLVAVDASGVLWRYNGDGKGYFTSRVQIGTGWNIYNTLVPIGDLDQDNRNDLLGRDANGVLWLYPGRGDGFLGKRVQQGTGFNAYKALY